MSEPFYIVNPTGFLVIENIRSYREYFEKIGGKRCEVLNGWWFNELLRPSVLELQNKIKNGELKPQTIEIYKETKWKNNVNLNGTRSGKKWNSIEEEDLLNEIKKNQNFEDLAQKHKRSVSAIKERLVRIVDKMKEENKTDEEIFTITGLSTEQINCFRFSSKWRRNKVT